MKKGRETTILALERVSLTLPYLSGIALDKPETLG